MAVAFCGDEGECEGVPTGMPALVREWRDEEHFEVVDFSVDLSHCGDAVQLVVSALPPTDHQFKGVFDDDGLTQAGFGHSVSFPNRLKIIRKALTGDSAMTATLKADGRDLNLEIKVPMLDFEAAYKLPLKREQLSESEVIAVKLLKAEQQLAESQARVAEMHKINEELMESTKAMEDEMVTMKKKLAGASGDCITQIRESKEESSGFPAAVDTREAVHPSVDFRFDATLKKGATDPSPFRISTDCKTATQKGATHSLWQLLLTPAVTNGRHSVVFRLENVGLKIGIGVTDDCREWMCASGCLFCSSGIVCVKGEIVTLSSPFSGAHKRDQIKLVVDLDNGKVNFEGANGQCTAHWKPRTGRRIWIGFHSYKGSLTIV